MITRYSLVTMLLILACSSHQSKQVTHAAEKQREILENTAAGELLEGTWKAVQCKSDGVELPLPKEGMELIFKDGLFNLKLGDKVVGRGTYSADPSAKPKTIDILNSGEEFKGKKTLGIYELKGGELWMALATAGETIRPVDFSCKKLSGHVLAIYKK